MPLSLFGLLMIGPILHIPTQSFGLDFVDLKSLSRSYPPYSWFNIFESPNLARPGRRLVSNFPTLISPAPPRSLQRLFSSKFQFHSQFDS